MNAERFQMLADAYGGDIRRWPQGEQAPAWRWLEDNERARSMLVNAGALDALLNASAPLMASCPLRERVIASAPLRRPVWGRPAAWMSGAGLAAACAAGVLLGASYSSLVLPAPQEDVLTQTASAFDGGSWFAGLESGG